MKELRQRIPSVNMAYYVSMRTIEDVHNALEMPLGRGIGADSPKHETSIGDGDDDGDFIEEEVADEAYDAQDDDFI